MAVGRSILVIWALRCDTEAILVDLALCYTVTLNPTA